MFIFSALDQEGQELVNKIYNDLNQMMYGLAIVILKDKSKAEDALSNTFYKISNHLEKIRQLEDEEIAPYCIQILKNESYNIIKEEKKYVYVEDIGEYRLSDRSVSPENIEEDYISRERIEEIQAIIEELSDDEKHLLDLRYVYNLPFNQIAKILEISEAAVKMRSSRLNKKLKEIYDKGGVASGYY